MSNVAERVNVDGNSFNMVYGVRSVKTELTHEQMKEEWSMVSKWLGLYSEIPDEGEYIDGELLKYTRPGSDTYIITVSGDSEDINGMVVYVASSLSMAILQILESAKYNHNNCDVEWVKSENHRTLLFTYDGIFARIESISKDMSSIDF